MSRRAITLRRQLVTLVLATTLPLLVFSAAVTLWIADIQGTVARHGLETTTRVLSLALDKQVETWQAALAAFATSPAFDEGNVAALREQAMAMARRVGGWVVVSLPSGQQVVNTLEPPGAPLPQSDPTMLPRTLPPDGVVQDLFEAPATGQLALAVTVPVLRQGEITHYLYLGIHPEHLAALLASEWLPAGWNAVLVNDRNRVIASAPTPFVGEPAPDWYVQGVGSGTRAEHGFITGRAPDGTELIAAFERQSNAPWTITVAGPRATLAQVWERPLALLAGGGAVLLLAVSVIAYRVGSRLTRPVDGLAEAARAAIGGQPLPPVPSSGIRELASLRTAVVELSRKQILLREANHRIKNSLQLVSAMLGLQGRMRAGDEETQELFREAQARIQAVARLHERLYMADQYDSVDAVALARAVCEDIEALSAGRAKLRFDGEGVAPIGAEAAGPFALIVAELATNAIKHGPGPDRLAVIDVRCRLEDGPEISVVISDNGPGLPPGFDLSAQKGLGLRMCLDLAAQAGGTLRVVRPDHAAFELRLPALGNRTDGRAGAIIGEFP